MILIKLIKLILMTENSLHSLGFLKNCFKETTVDREIIPRVVSNVQ